MILGDDPTTKPLLSFFMVVGAFHCCAAANVKSVVTIDNTERQLRGADFIRLTDLLFGLPERHTWYT